MRPPASESENRTHGAKKLGRVNTPTFSTESTISDICTAKNTGTFAPSRTNPSARRPLRRPPSARGKVSSLACPPTHPMVKNREPRHVHAFAHCKKCLDRLFRLNDHVR
jgi:hypothetical protein